MTRLRQQQFPLLCLPQRALAQCRALPLANLLLPAIPAVALAVLMKVAL